MIITLRQICRIHVRNILNVFWMRNLVSAFWSWSSWLKLDFSRIDLIMAFWRKRSCALGWSISLVIISFKLATLCLVWCSGCSRTCCCWRIIINCIKMKAWIIWVIKVAFVSRIFIWEHDIFCLWKSNIMSFIKKTALQNWSLNTTLWWWWNRPLNVNFISSLNNIPDCLSTLIIVFLRTFTSFCVSKKALFNTTNNSKDTFGWQDLHRQQAPALFWQLSHRLLDQEWAQLIFWASISSYDL